MLAGRARTAELFSLVYPEIPDFDLDRYLLSGGLPDVYLSDSPFEELKAYVDTYLKEEILAEGLIRSLPSFARFLSTASQCAGQLINFSAVASDSQVGEGTVRNYYQILTDTLLGFQLEPFLKTKTRKAIQTAKFYFFDLGIMHQLLGVRSLSPKIVQYGFAFEHWIAQELRAYLSYNRLEAPLGFWRSTAKHEVDFTLGTTLAIEVKAKNHISERDMDGIRALKEEGVFKKYFVVSLDTVERKTEDGIELIHWQNFMNRLWHQEWKIS